MPKISIVINLDTRPGLFENSSQADTIMKGTRCVDFLTEGVINKINFFRGFETEVILFVDVHENIPPDILSKMQEISTSVVLSKHREFFDEFIFYPKWNDLNFLHALSLARGEYIAHFDSDMAAFLKDPSVVHQWIQWIQEGKYNYISYPSRWSPVAVEDPDFSDYMWVSTRFFFCKRSIIKVDEINKCLSDSEYLYGTYGEKKRRCPWLEHVLGIMVERDSIFYPPIDINKSMIFAWNFYTKGLFERLNMSTYEEVEAYVQKRGISFPCDVWGDF